jgi:hypothetical protein
MNFKRLPCFEHLNWNPGKKDRQEFALAMLAGFSLLGTIALVRAHHFTPAVVTLWIIGAALAAVSCIPRLGRATYLAVNVPTSLVGYLVSRIALVVVFFLVFVPIGQLLKWAGRDLLQLHRRAAGWTVLGSHRGPSDYYHQF